jgi:hypothetical protein
MKRIGIALFGVLVLAFPLAAQMNATVEKITGKVELLAPGGSWQTARVGMNVDRGTIVSTGFRSSALLDLGTSELTVMQLTRLSVEELARQENTVTTTLNLRTGTVRAKVKTVPGTLQNFKLRSPVSTAAVRGTEFVFDPYRVQVIDGVVEFFNVWNERAAVAAGNTTQTGDDGGLADQEEEQRSGSEVSTGTGGPGTEPPPPPPPPAPPTYETTGAIDITVTVAGEED